MVAVDTLMQRCVIGFHKDSADHWVAELACGHFQHTRHDPPWVNRPWVATREGRESVIGRTLACKKFDAVAPPDRL